ncbi:MAG: hypothetical protein AAF432_00910 [Planctomycetota bacterium]
MDTSGNTPKPRDHEDSPLRFPSEQAEDHSVDLHDFLGADLPESPEELVDAIEAMIGRMNELARELNCFGYFDDGDDDGPRAA